MLTLPGIATSDHPPCKVTYFYHWIWAEVSFFFLGKYFLILCLVLCYNPSLHMLLECYFVSLYNLAHCAVITSFVWFTCVIFLSSTCILLLIASTYLSSEKKGWGLVWFIIICLARKRVPKCLLGIYWANAGLWAFVCAMICLYLPLVSGSVHAVSLLSLMIQVSSHHDHWIHRISFSTSIERAMFMPTPYSSMLYRSDSFW